MRTGQFFALISLVTILCSASPAETEGLSQRVHVHYYGWYGNPETNGHWSHWDHAVTSKSGPPPGNHKPPEDIGSPFYPQLGLYSSQDPDTLKAHLEMIAKAGIGVVNFSWWGPGNADDRALELLFAEAAKKGMKVNFHIEPYPGRSAESVKENLGYLIDKFKGSPALYRDADRDHLPMFYVYDSYLIPTEEWGSILRSDSPNTIRGTEHDAIMIALYVNQKDKRLLTEGGFDGVYTYFATKGFTEGSTPDNWKEIRDWTHSLGKLFIPSVGPGYDDLPIRPWNKKNYREREGGDYYSTMFESAIEARPDFISVTSFNEWHEGTQIEPAVPAKYGERQYRDYLPLKPDGYLDLSHKWVKEFEAVQAEEQ
ncbi:MAG: alpha-mannosidase [Candidatus Omnitrophica bacterium]|nr:alpha-mannosidase [Candidatus Omnitrophota bacterium]